MSKLASACTFLLVAAAPARAADSWNYMVSPYLWATGINGTQAIAGRELEVDASFSDLLEVLDIGFALHFEAQGPAWGWFGDVFYAKLSDEQNLPAATLEGDTEQTIAELGVSYPFSPVLEGLAGVRYQGVDIGLTITGLGTVANNESWFDAFLGLRWTPVKTDKWWLTLRGDVGAGESDLVWSAAVNAGYRFNRNWSLIAGYRYLDTDYENGGFRWDIAQSGLGIGVGYSW